MEISFCILRLLILLELQDTHHFIQTGLFFKINEPIIFVVKYVANILIDITKKELYQMLGLVSSSGVLVTNNAVIFVFKCDKYIDYVTTKTVADCQFL